jgi:hypothetical protein
MFRVLGIGVAVIVRTSTFLRTLMRSLCHAEAPLFVHDEQAEVLEATSPTAGDADDHVEAAGKSEPAFLDLLRSGSG